MGKREREPFIIKLGTNSEPENLEKLSKIYCRLKAKMMLKELENYPEDIREEVFKRFEHFTA